MRFVTLVGLKLRQKFLAGDLGNCFRRGRVRSVRPTSFHRAVVWLLWLSVAQLLKFQSVCFVVNGTRTMFATWENALASIKLTTIFLDCASHLYTLFELFQFEKLLLLSSYLLLQTCTLNAEHMTLPLGFFVFCLVMGDSGQRIAATRSLRHLNRTHNFHKLLNLVLQVDSSVLACVRGLFLLRRLQLHRQFRLKFLNFSFKLQLSLLLLLGLFKSRTQLFIQVFDLLLPLMYPSLLVNILLLRQLQFLLK